MSRSCRRKDIASVIPIGAWPAADLAAWRRALAPGDILEPGGPAGGWSPKTVVKHRNGYGRWLGFLAGQ